MEKALHREEIAFLYQKDGEVRPHEMNIEEIVHAVNRAIQGEWEDSEPHVRILQKVYEWICRYLEEGANEELLNELNDDLRHMQYSNYVVPANFYSPDGKEPKSIYIANLNKTYTVETFAAMEFSRFITYGMLHRLRRCQLPECMNIFLGPPQAKWCSPRCGSMFRVREKRKRDASR